MWFLEACSCLLYRHMGPSGFTYSPPRGGLARSLWFEGRADSLFKSGGIWVSPLEIENCLLEHDAVALAAVIPAERDGLSKPKAFVVLRESERSRAGEGLAKELQQHVQDCLSKHKYPRWVEFVDELPKNDRGKVDRKLLIERERSGTS